MNNKLNFKFPLSPLNPARIGIDARFYGPTGKGLGRYSKEIIDNIIKLDQANEYVIFLTPENFGLFSPPENKKVKKVLINIPWYGIKEQLFFPLYIIGESLDLMHFPHFNVPIFCPRKFIVTIHDLILIKFPTQRATTLGPVFYAVKKFFYKIVIFLAVKRARQILTVSLFTKKDIIRQFRARAEKIIVAYEGVADVLSGGQAESAEKALIKYGVKKPFLLYVGNAYPHKNLEKLIKVFLKLKPEKPDLRLVLVGKDDYFYNRLKFLSPNESADIIFPGYVPDADLKTFYRQALAYVFPSFYEGFGLPPLEAMANGLPVVS